jgi:hypothetical protein
MTFPASHPAIKPTMTAQNNPITIFYSSGAFVLYTSLERICNFEYADNKTTCCSACFKKETETRASRLIHVGNSRNSGAAADYLMSAEKTLTRG